MIRLAEGSSGSLGFGGRAKARETLQFRKVLVVLVVLVVQRRGASVATTRFEARLERGVDQRTEQCRCTWFRFHSRCGWSTSRLPCRRQKTVRIYWMVPAEDYGYRQPQPLLVLSSIGFDDPHSS